jgi:hypothetical protein
MAWQFGNSEWKMEIRKKAERKNKEGKHHKQ